MEWWELSLTAEKRGEYLNKYLPGRESITDKEIFYIWEAETGRGEPGDSSIGELDGEKWELYGNLIATNNKTEAICELVGQLNPKFNEWAALIASAPALKKENDRLKGKFDPAPLPEKYTRWDLYMMLYNLTPGGSEFALDPKACADWVTEQRNSIPSTIKGLKEECAELDDIRMNLTSERDELIEENDRLKEQNKQLADALLAVYGDIELNNVKGGSDHLNVQVLQAIESFESTTK